MRGTLLAPIHLPVKDAMAESWWTDIPVIAGLIYVIPRKGRPLLAASDAASYRQIEDPTTLAAAAIKGPGFKEPSCLARSKSLAGLLCAKLPVPGAAR